MTFRQLMEADCGQSNPLEQLSRHVLHQDRIARPLTSGYSTQGNPMPPQTFRMEDLMQEINMIEHQAATRSPTLSSTIVDHFPGSALVEEYTAQLAQKSQNYSFSSSLELSRDCRLTDPQQLISWQSPSLGVDQQYEVQQFWDSLEKRNEIEQKDKEEFQEESSEDVTPSSKPLICWDGCYIEDEFQVPNGPLPELQLLYEFDRAYAYKYCNEGKSAENTTKNPKNSASKLSNNNSYTFNKSNPMLEHSTAYEEGEDALKNNEVKAMLCFEAAVYQDPSNLNKWLKLCEELYANCEFQKALDAVNQILEMAPNNRSAYFYKAMIYYQEGYYYQSFQYIMDWLSCHELYSDIVPPNFEMEDQTVTQIYHNTLKAVKKMLIKAAQRSPINPDVEVQDFLSMLCYLSEDYEKVIDCLSIISTVNPETRRAKKARIEIGLCLLYFMNQPAGALSAFLGAADLEVAGCSVHQFIGFTFMYVKRYRIAAHYLIKGLIKKYTTITDEANFREDFARLSLCIEMLLKTDGQGKTVDDFLVALPEFMKSYYETHFAQPVENSTS